MVEGMWTGPSNPTALATQAAGNKMVRLAARVPDRLQLLSQPCPNTALRRQHADMA